MEKEKVELLLKRIKKYLELNRYDPYNKEFLYIAGLEVGIEIGLGIDSQCSQMFLEVYEKLKVMIID